MAKDTYAMTSEDDIIVVGIDIGMTFTGVAHACYYAKSREFSDVKSIKHWPSRATHEAVLKAPTVVSIPKLHGLAKWGVESEELHDTIERVIRLDRHGVERQEGRQSSSSSLSSDPITFERESYEHIDRFKLLMDRTLAPKYWERRLNPDEDHAGVRECYRVFLTELYHLITRTLVYTYRGRRPGSFLKSHWVQYMFSVPVNWGDQAIEDFEKIIKDAGFGELPKHSYHVGPKLTEADAAAIFTLEQLINTLRMEKDDIMIVADLGGGTTDVTSVRIKSLTQERSLYKLEHCGGIEGRLIGGTNIDQGIRDYLLHGLPLEDPHGQWRRSDDWHLRKEIASLKMKYAEEIDETLRSGGYQLQVIAPRTTNMSLENLNYPEWGITMGRRTLPRRLIQWLYDLQLNGSSEPIPPQLYRNGFQSVLDQIYGSVKHDGIFSMIDKEVAAMDLLDRRRTYLSLTGGFSSSKYIQNQVRARYATSKELYLPDNKILTPQLPHLAVCMGLVSMRLREISSDGDFFIRRCRASYGVVFNKLHEFDNIDASRENVRIRNHSVGDRRRFGSRFQDLDRIYWLIDKGDLLPESEASEPAASLTVRLVTRSDIESIFWNVSIVRYSGSLIERPDSRAGFRQVRNIKEIKCEFSPTLKELNKNIKRRFNIWKFETHWKIPYEIRVIVGPAMLRFKLWFNGRELGEGADGIPVDFVRMIREDSMKENVEGFERKASFGQDSIVDSEITAIELK